MQGWGTRDPGGLAGQPNPSGSRELCSQAVWPSPEPLLPTPEQGNLANFPFPPLTKLQESLCAEQGNLTRE